MRKRSAKIHTSEFTDFCFGVKRAISLAESALERCPSPVFSLGSLIHNRQVVTGLSKKGLRVVNDLSKVRGGTLVIRSHGIMPNILRSIDKKVHCVDATCPFVKNAQHIAGDLFRRGYAVIIVGDKGHPEVKALKHYAGTTGIIVSSRSEIKNLSFAKRKVGVIAQTTQSQQNFRDIVSELLKKDFTEVRIYSTICKDANMRQESARRCSRISDLVIVIGGKNSANTKRLYDICKGMGTCARHIETAKEIKRRWLTRKKTIGVVSGASTPKWIVDDVIRHLRLMT